MQRLRELAAHGGIMVLAVVFAAALAAFHLAGAFAQLAILALSQHIGDSRFGLLEFEVAGTEIYYGDVLETAIALLFVIAGLYGVWKLTRRASRTCAECRSLVPLEATVCRYCTSELRELEG